MTQTGRVVRNDSSGKGQQTGGQTSESQRGSGSPVQQLRGMSFDEGEAMLAPPPEPNAPVQRKVSTSIPKPGLGAVLTSANYTKIYDKYAAYQKAKSPAQQRTLLRELDGLLDAWLIEHDGSKKHDDKRLPSVRQLAGAVKLELANTPSTETPPTTTAPTTTTPTVTPPTTTPTVEQTTTPTVTPPTVEQTTPETTTTPTVTPPTTTPTVEQTTTPTTTTPPPTTPTGFQLPAAPQLCTINQLKQLNADDIHTYVTTRPQGHVQGLRGNSQFVNHLKSFGVDQMARITIAIILRTPDQVVDRVGATNEAMRILGSQLRNLEVMGNLLKNNVRVVIVPRTALMTDLPEFAAQRGTFTFDGRPWDTTRGLGGRNTAITEENLLGEELTTGALSRLGWDSQTSMENARATDPNAMPVSGGPGVITHNPGVYCSGYSTTNHEFFHTIHNYGLNATDNSTITSEYNTKKSQPRTTEWADGPRLHSNGANSENYASSTVYEYWAQTGCAFQGTNVGTDPYTGRQRNNGRSWVTTNEPGLAAILSKVCSNSELMNANPRALRAQATGTGTPTTTPGTTAPTTAPTTTGGATTTPTPGSPPPIGQVAPESTRVGGDAVGAIVGR